ncbi:MAG: DNA recombination protein RmuC, partial [Fluviibacter sp.]
ERLPQLEGRLIESEQQLNALNAQVATLTMQLTQERNQSNEKLALLQSAREELTHQFKNLANDILEEKSKRFSEQNQQSLGQLLDPLKTKLQEFQGKVEQVYVQEGKDRSALAEQVRQLMELNKTVSQEANNLTKALKGSNKTQGNWGELVLERVLESSGLRKGEEYDVQESHTLEDGRRLQPDVVVHLPDDRHLVIDAKATLIAYEDYANAEDDKHRDAALKRHLDAVRSHIKGLSDKNYQDLYGLKSLDFVLMFVPIEPAFMLAVTHDRELYMDAWNKNVLLVSPSTLLFVVRTVANLWRQEAQTRNAQDIAKRGAELYDKLAGFVEDMESLGTRLNQAQKDYDGAINKLSTGRGNVIRQAEMLKKLGVKPSKSLPAPMVEIANDAADME